MPRRHGKKKKGMKASGGAGAAAAQPTSGAGAGTATSSHDSTVQAILSSKTVLFEHFNKLCAFDSKGKDNPYERLVLYRYACAELYKNITVLQTTFFLRTVDKRFEKLRVKYEGLKSLPALTEEQQADHDALKELFEHPEVIEAMRLLLLKSRQTELSEDEIAHGRMFCTKYQLPLLDKADKMAAFKVDAHLIAKILRPAMHLVRIKPTVDASQAKMKSLPSFKYDFSSLLTSHLVQIIELLDREEIGLSNLLSGYAEKAGEPLGQFYDVSTILEDALPSLISAYTLREVAFTDTAEGSLLFVITFIQAANELQKRSKEDALKRLSLADFVETIKVLHKNNYNLFTRLTETIEDPAKRMKKLVQIFKMNFMKNKVHTLTTPLNEFATRIPGLGKEAAVDPSLRYIASLNRDALMSMHDTACDTADEHKAKVVEAAARIEAESKAAEEIAAALADEEIAKEKAAKEAAQRRAEQAAQEAARRRAIEEARHEASENETMAAEEARQRAVETAQHEALEREVHTAARHNMATLLAKHMTFAEDTATIEAPEMLSDVVVELPAKPSILDSTPDSDPVYFDHPLFNALYSKAEEMSVGLERCFRVHGGALRDFLEGQPITDLDIECFTPGEWLNTYFTTFSNKSAPFYFSDVKMHPPKKGCPETWGVTLNIKNEDGIYAERIDITRYEPAANSFDTQRTNHMNASHSVDSLFTIFDGKGHRIATPFHLEGQDPTSSAALKTVMRSPVQKVSWLSYAEDPVLILRMLNHIAKGRAPAEKDLAELSRIETDTGICRDAHASFHSYYWSHASEMMSKTVVDFLATYPNLKACVETYANMAPATIAPSVASSVSYSPDSSVGSPSIRRESFSFRSRSSAGDAAGAGASP